VGNPANPDPTAAVRWGEQTWEEMMIGYVDVDAPIGAWKRGHSEELPGGD